MDVQDIDVQSSTKVFAVNTRLEIVLWDAAMATLTSVSSKAAIGQPISSLFNEEDYDESLLRLLREACRGRHSTLRQMSYVFNDGSEALLLLSVMPHRGVSAIEGAICVLRNYPGIPPSLTGVNDTSSIVCSGESLSSNCLVSYITFSIDIVEELVAQIQLKSR